MGIFDTVGEISHSFSPKQVLIMGFWGHLEPRFFDQKIKKSDTCKFMYASASTERSSDALEAFGLGRDFDFELIFSFLDEILAGFWD